MSYAALLVAIMLLLVTSYSFQMRYIQHAQKNLEDNLTAILQTTQKSLIDWRLHEQTITKGWAESSEISSLVEKIARNNQAIGY
jgi:hypothetical protein